MALQNNQSNTTGNEAEFANCNQFPGQQRSSRRGSPPSRRIPVHTFSSRETGQKWRISTSNKPESSQSVPSERDIQNGESQHSSVTPTSGRFHDKNGLKRRILCGTNLSSSQKVSEVPVRKGDLRVPVPSLWPGISSKGIYQTPETYCCSDSVQGHTDSYISGRSPHYASGQSAMSEDIQPSQQSVIQPGIPDQTREMLELPNPTNNISGCTFEHHFNDHCLTRGEDGIDCTDQSSDAFNTPMFITRTLYAPRPHEPCGSNRCLDSPAPLPHASEDTHRRNSALGFQVEKAHSSATGVAANPAIPTRDDSPTVAFSAPDSMAHIRKRHRTAGLSSEVIKILLSSWSPATQKKYSAPWNAWAQWCTSHGLCPVSAPVTDMLSFLANLTTQGLEYRTIAVYKSAISQVHDPVGQTTLGNLLIVSRFMKGIFRSTTPKPRLCSVWKVADALNWVSTLEPIERLSLREITQKLVLLLALTSAARAHELAKLSLDFVSIKTKEQTLSNLIRKRQKALNQGNIDEFKRLRNHVNRKRKSC